MTTFPHVLSQGQVNPAALLNALTDLKTLTLASLAPPSPLLTTFD